MIGRILGTAKWQQAEIERITAMEIVSPEQKKALVGLVFTSSTTFKVLQRCAAITAGGVAIVFYGMTSIIYLWATLFIDDPARMELITTKIWVLFGCLRAIGYMGLSAFTLYLGGGALEGAAKVLGYKKG